MLSFSGHRQKAQGQRRAKMKRLAVQLSRSFTTLSDAAAET